MFIRDARPLPLSFVRLCCKVVRSNAGTQFLGMFSSGRRGVTHRILKVAAMVVSALSGSESHCPVVVCLPLSSTIWV